MNIALKQAGTSAEKMVASLSGAGMNQSLNTFLQTFATADRNLIGINAKLKEMQRVLAQSVKFNLAMGVQNFVIGQIQGAIGWVQDLNDEITNIAIVSGKVGSELDAVFTTILNGSQKLRVAAQDYAEAAFIFYQQGLDTAEVEHRTEITIKAAKAAGQSVKDMSEQLTAVWNTYKMSGDELERAASIGAKLGAATAVEFKDIAVGMEIAASAASQLGVSYESLASIVATVGETTKQSASTIGNAYKTIFARFAQLKAEGTDGEVTLGQISEQLSSLGVNILDASGELRDLDEVFQQLGRTWDQYSKKQQVAIAQAAGGVRQYGQFLAYMQNFDKYEANLLLAQSERGGESLDAQYMASLKSIDSAITNSTEKWRRAFAQIFTSDSQIEFYKTLENIGGIFDSMVKSVGGLQGILTIVGALLLQKVAPVVRDIGLGIKEWKDNLTIGMQQKAIDKTTDRMKGELTTLGEKTGKDVSGDIRKVELTQEAAKQEAILNKLIKEGNAETRIRAQYLKDQLMIAQQSGMEALDELMSYKESTGKLAEKVNKMREGLDVAKLTLEIEKEVEALKSAETVEEDLYMGIAVQEESLRIAQDKKAVADEEVKSAQAFIAAVGQGDALAQSRLKTAQAAQQAATKEVQEISKSISVLKSRASAASEEVNARQKSLKALQSTLAAEKAGEGPVSRKNKALEKSSQILDAIAEHTKNVVDGMSELEQKQGLVKNFQDIKDAMGDMGEEGEELGRILDDAMENIRSGSIEGAFDILAEELNGFNETAGVTGPILQQIRDEISGVGSATGELTDANNNLNDSQTRTAQVAAESQMSITQYGQELGKVVGGVAIASKGILAMSDALKGGQVDWAGFAAGAMMAIPSLMSLTQSVFKVVGSLAAKAVADGIEKKGAPGNFAASLMRAMGYTLEGAAATAATIPVWVLIAALIALIAIVVLVTVAIMASIKAKEEERKANLASAKAAAESVEANKALRDSLDDVKKSLESNTKAFKDGEMSLEDYTKSIEETRKQLVQMMKDNPQLEINLAEFDAAPAERKIEMFQEAIEQTNKDIIKDAERASEYLNNVYGQGVDDKTLKGKENEKGLEALKDTAKKLPKEIQDEIKKNGKWDLTGIAENYDTLMENMSNTQKEQFRKMMGELDGFSDKLNTTVAAVEAEAALMYAAFQKDPGSVEGGLVGMIERASLADQIKIDNKEALDALEEKRKLITDEKAILQERADILAMYVDEYGNYPQEYLDIQERLSELDSQMSTLDSSRADILGQVAEAMKGAEMSYELLTEQIRNAGTKEEKQMLTAIQLLAQHTDRSVHEVAVAAKESSDELNEAIRLIEIGRNELVGLGDEFKLTINLAFEKSGIDALRNQFKALSEDMSGKEKIEWLDKANAQIEELNKTMTELGKTDELLLPLEDSFFSMSKSAQEAYLAELDHAMAVRDVANAQEQLNQINDIQASVLEKAGIATDNLNLKTVEGIAEAKTQLKEKIEASELAHQIEMAEVNASIAAKTEAHNLAMQQQQTELQGILDAAQAARDAQAAAGKDTSKEDAALATAKAKLNEFQTEQAAKLEQDLTDERARQAAETERYENLIGLQNQFDDLLNQERALKVEVEEGLVANLTEAEQAVRSYDAALQMVADAKTAEQLAAATKGLEASWDDLVKATADGIGIDDKTLEDYTKHIMRTAQASDLLADSLAENQKVALKVAAATIRANEGYGKLEKGLDQIKKDIDGINKKEIDIGSQRAMESINDLDEALSDILNIDVGSLSLDMLIDPKTIKLAEDALKGVEGALWDLQQMAATSILQNMFPEEDLTSLNMLQGQFADLVGAIDTAAQAGWQLGQELSEIEGIDNLVSDIQGNAAEIVRQMQNMGASADEVQKYFNSMGMEIEGEKETVKTQKTIDTTDTIETLTPSTTTVRQPIQRSDGSWGTTPVTYTAMKRSVKTIPGTETIEAEQEVFSFTGKDGNGGFTGTMTGGGAKLTNISSGGTKAGATMAAPANRGGGGRDTGGGGGGKEPKQVTGTTKEFGERYRDINDALKEISDRLGKVATAEDKAFGLNKLRLISQTNALLQEQAKKYQDLQKAAEKYQTVSAGRPVKFGKGFIDPTGGDQAVLQKMLKAVGAAPATFDPKGFVSNAEVIMNQLYDLQMKKLKDLGAKYDETIGQWVFGLDDAGEAQKQLFEDAVAELEAVESYIGTVNDTAQQILDAQAKQLEIIHDWLSNKIKEVDYKLELRMAVNAADLRQIEFLIGRLGERAGLISMDYFNQSAGLAIDNAKSLIGATERLFEITEHINAPDNIEASREWFEKQFGAGAWQDFLDNGGAYTEEMLSTLMDKADQMQTVIEQLYGYSEQMFGVFHKALNLYIGDFDRLLATYDNHASMLDSWSEIWRVAGEPWKNQRLQVDLLNKGIDNQTSKVKGLQEKYAFLNGQLANAKEHYELALAAHGADDKITQESLQAWKDLQAQVEETGATVMSEIAGLATMIENAAREMAQVIAREFTTALGGLFADVDSAMAMFSQKKAVDTFFVNEEEAGFKIAEMLRNAEKDMKDVTDPALLSEHAKWADYLNGLIEKRVVMTEHLGEMVEEEIWVTKDGVELREVDLDIAQKEFELMKAKAAFEEQQQMKTTMRLQRDASGNWSYVYSGDDKEEKTTEDDVEKRINDIRALHRQAAEEASEMWLQVWTEYRKYIEEIDWQRYEQDDAYRKEVDTRISWYETQLDQHAGQIEKHNAAIDRSFADTTLAVILDMDDMSEANDKYKENTRGLMEALHDNYTEYQQLVHDKLEEVGIDTENLEQTINDETDKMMRKNEDNEESVKQLRETAEKELQLIMDKTRDWSSTWQNEIRDLITALNELIAKILELQAIQSGNADAGVMAEFGRAIETKNIEQQQGENTQQTFSDNINDPAVQAILARMTPTGRQAITDLYQKGGYGYDNSMGTFVYWNAANHKRQGFDLNSYLSDYAVAGNIAALDLEKYKLYTGGLVRNPINGVSLAEKGPELVLNDSDTENFLKAIQIMRDSIAQHLVSLGMKQSQVIGGATQAMSESVNNQPPVIIQADFPNVTARDEIEAAFANLVNQAAQYQLKPRG